MRRIIALLALLGALFSGYLTGSFIFSSSCSFGCSSFLGYPTCVYGFVLFCLLLFFAVLDYPYSRHVVATVALIGMLFSLWFALRELAVCVACYPLGLPNCVYGLALYLVIAVLAIVPKEPRKPQRLKSGHRPEK